MKLLGKLFISGQIHVKTGLTIGGSSNDISIGGITSVIKTSEGVPYIPGSSLKGKLRSLIERSKGLAKVCNCGEDNCYICRIFGVAASNKEPQSGPTRLYVRDSYLEKNSRQKIEEKKGQFGELELRYTEVKAENVLDRLTSKSEHFRQSERVPAGARFEFEMIYNILSEQDIDNLKHLIKALRMLEDDYLGGSGSRGYGRIEFEEFEVKLKTVETYEGSNEAELISKGLSTEIPLDKLRQKLVSKTN